MNNVAELPNEHTLILKINEKNRQKVTYIFKNKYENIIAQYESTVPATLTPQSNIAQEYKQIVDPEGNFKPAVVKKKFSELKELLTLRN